MQGAAGRPAGAAVRGASAAAAWHVFAARRTAKTATLATERQPTRLVTQRAPPPHHPCSAVYKEAGFPHEVVSDLTCRKWQVGWGRAGKGELGSAGAVLAPHACSRQRRLLARASIWARRGACPHQPACLPSPPLPDRLRYCVLPPRRCLPAGE